LIYDMPLVGGQLLLLFETLKHNRFSLCSVEPGAVGGGQTDQQDRGLGDECYRPPPKSETSAYVVARIVPVASDYEDSLVRVARATRLI
jgi:hypothetical protein